MKPFDGRSANVVQIGYGAVDFTGAEAIAIALYLPAGRWKLETTGRAQWSVGVADTHGCGMYLRAGSITGALLATNTATYGPANGTVPFSLLGLVTFAAPTTVLMTGAPTAPGVGTQLLSLCVLIATPV